MRYDFLHEQMHNSKFFNNVPSNINIFTTYLNKQNTLNTCINSNTKFKPFAGWGRSAAGAGLLWFDEHYSMSRTFAISDTFGAIIDILLMSFRLLCPRPVPNNFFKAWSTIVITKMLPGSSQKLPAGSQRFPGSSFWSIRGCLGEPAETFGFSRGAFW